MFSEKDNLKKKQNKGFEVKTMFLKIADVFY